MRGGFWPRRALLVGGSGSRAGRQLVWITDGESWGSFSWCEGLWFSSEPL